MKRDQILVEKLLSAYNRHHGTLYSVVRWPEESNRKTEAVEAVAANALGQTIAFEHTLIEPFVGEREDTDRFMRVFSRLEGNADLMKPGDDVGVVVGIRSILTGVKWEKVAELVHRHLASRIPRITEGNISEEIPGVGFPLEVKLMISAHDSPGQDHVWIQRSLPGDSLVTVVRRALARKLPKLVAEPADKRILLLEKAVSVGGHYEIRAAMDELLGEFPQLRIIDEVWLAITPGWESEDVLFFCELLPELSGRRLMMRGASTPTPEIKVLGTAV